MPLDELSRKLLREGLIEPAPEELILRDHWINSLSKQEAPQQLVAHHVDKDETRSTDYYKGFDRAVVLIGGEFTEDLLRDRQLTTFYSILQSYVIAKKLTTNDPPKITMPGVGPGMRALSTIWRDRLRHGPIGDDAILSVDNGKPKSIDYHVGFSNAIFEFGSILPTLFPRLQHFLSGRADGSEADLTLASLAYNTHRLLEQLRPKN